MGLERVNQSTDMIARMKAAQQAQQLGQAQFGQRSQSPQAVGGAQKTNVFMQPPAAGVTPPQFAGTTGVGGVGSPTGVSPLSKTADTGFVVPRVNLVSSGVPPGGGYVNAGPGQGTAFAGGRLNKLG